MRGPAVKFSADLSGSDDTGWSCSAVSSELLTLRHLLSEPRTIFKLPARGNVGGTPSA